MDPTSIDDFLEYWLIKEQTADQELNTVKQCSEHLAKLLQDIKEIENASEGANNEIFSLQSSLNNITADNKIFKIKLEAWKQTFEKANDEHNQVKNTLEETQTQIWRQRREYCDDVKQFLEKYGIKAMIHKNFEKSARQQLATALNDIVINSGSDNVQKKKPEEIIRLENEIENEKIILADLEIKLLDLQKLNEGLQDGVDNAECISLRNALKYSRDEAMKYREELNNLEKRLDIMNTSIINDLLEDDSTRDSNQFQVLEQIPRPVPETNSMPFCMPSDFQTAKNVYEANKFSVVNENIMIKPNQSIFETSALTRSSVSSGAQHDNVHFFSVGNVNHAQSYLNDPYKQIMEIKDKYKKIGKHQKGAFKLVNNNK